MLNFAQLFLLLFETLADRTWTCGGCGTVHDRDENASDSIFKEGRRIVTLNYAVLLSFGSYRELHGKYASGDRTNASGTSRECKPQSERGINQSLPAQT